MGDALAVHWQRVTIAVDRVQLEFDNTLASMSPAQSQESALKNVNEISKGL